MDDPVSHGHAFVVGDLWRAPSEYLIGHELHESIFEALDTSAVPLNLPTSEGTPHFSFHAGLPALPDLDNVTDAKIDFQEKTLPSPTQEIPDLDVWNLDDASCELPESSDLCTWETFDNKSVANAQHIAFLSEAGQAAFDALDHAANKEGVLPQDFTLRALCSLAHGRSSTLFQWDGESRSFHSVLPGFSTSGISQICGQSLAKDLTEMGTTIVRLREFGDAAYSNRIACSAVVAMQNSIVSVLDAIDGIMCRQLSAVQSLLQLQHLIVRPRQLLGVFFTLVESVRGCKTDEGLISSLSDHIHALATTTHEYTAVLRAFLARTSVPWLEQLSMDLGLCDDTQLISEFRGTEGLGELTKEKHTFLDDADISLIHETKMAAALLRDLDPGHPLLGGPTHIDGLPSESFANPDSSLQRTNELARLYEAHVMRRMAERGLSQRTVSESVAIDAPLDDNQFNEGSQESYIADLEGLMSLDFDYQPPPVTDELHTLVSRTCRHDLVDGREGELDLSTPASSTPLERVRPFVSTQSRLVNGVLLRKVLRDHHLRQQLDKQMQFQLLGNGEFVTRLSTALFSLDVQSAERKRGVLPTGEVMGLRLGSSPDQRWPPASSELRLTLAGVLEESQGVKGATIESRGDQAGALSFAIRELPEEEIDRVLDVHSVHALDFLRLQYVPAPPLDAILTPEAIQQYDVVFRFLLKLLRQIHVVKGLPRKKNGRRGDISSGRIITFANESHHFVSVLMAHTMELGINAPWREFMISIEQLEHALNDEDEAGEIGTKAKVGIHGLKQMHEACLDRIRGRLLLKRKHTKLRVGIEAVFTAILRSAAVVTENGTMDEQAFAAQYVTFQQASSQLCEMLQQVVEKPPKVMSAAESEDADTIRVLLLKLNYNDFYLHA